MHDQHQELPIPQPQMITGLNSAARYPAGPSKDGPDGGASAPGVAEALGHQGVPKGEQSVDPAVVALPRAAEAAALHRVARRRKPDSNGQRKERVDARYSVEEKADILRMARSLNIAGAHYVGAVVMAHVHGDLALPGQRSSGGEHAARTSGWCNGHGGGSALCVEPHHSESGLFAATRVAAVGRPYRRPRRSRGVANEADARITGPRQARIPGWFAVDPLRSDKSWDRHWTRCHAQSRRPCPPTGQEAPCTGTPGRAIASYSVGPHGLPSWPGSLR